jgi:histidyl-tRNA synthetase
MQPKLVWLIAHGDAARGHNWNLMRDLRADGIAADMDVSGRSVKAQFKVADREKAAYCVVVGENELAAGTVVLKELQSGEQQTVPKAELFERLARVE